MLAKFSTYKFITLIILGGLIFSNVYSAEIHKSENDTSVISDKLRKALKVINERPNEVELLACNELKHTRQISYPFGEAQCLNILGTIELNKGNLKKALKYFEDALSIAMKLKRWIVIANLTNSIGQINEINGQYNKALDFYIKALEIRLKNNLINDLPSSYNNIAYIYEIQKDYKNSLKYYSQILKLGQLANETVNMAVAYNNIGSIYKEQKKYDSAIYCFNKALVNYVKLKDSTQIPYCYSNIAAIYVYQKKFDEAIEYLNKALPIAIATENMECRTDILINAGEAYKGLKQYNIALQKLCKAEELAKIINSPALLKEIYSNISAANDSLKDYRLAYIYFKKYSVINDSLVTKEKSKQLTEMQTKYDTEKKEEENSILSSNNKLKSRQLFYGSLAFILFLALSTIAFFFYQNRVRNKEILAAKNAQISNQKIDELLNQQEIKSFEAMIEGQEQERKRIAEDLHDGLGILLSTVKLHFSSIEDKLDKQVNAQEQFVKGSNLLDEALNEVRRIAHNMSSGLLTNIGLVPALADLKESLEFGSKLKVNLFTHNMEERLDVLTEISIYRMIQELLSNILKHANAHEISINLNRDKISNVLTIIIEDDGIGFDPLEKTGSTGMGLQNLRSRASRLNGKFNIDSNKGKGTTAIIVIPLLKVINDKLAS